MLHEPVITMDINSISTIDDVKVFSNRTRPIIETFLTSWTAESENKILKINSKNGKTFTFTYGKIMRHLISHKIHHIGQLSIWARSLGIKPISSDLLIRDYC
jgi:uncharacterized damage-inducible protein DinB